MNKLLDIKKNRDKYGVVEELDGVVKRYVSLLDALCSLCLPILERMGCNIYTFVNKLCLVKAGSGSLNKLGARPTL